MIQEIKSLYLITPRAEEYLSQENLFLPDISKRYEEFRTVLRGNPPVEDPLPGFNLPAQVILHKRIVSDTCEMLRVILGSDADDPLELDVLDIPIQSISDKYLHPSTIFFVLVSP